MLASLLGISGCRETKLPSPSLHSNKAGYDNDDNDDNDGGSEGVRDGGYKSDHFKCL